VALAERAEPRHQPVRAERRHRREHQPLPRAAYLHGRARVVQAIECLGQRGQVARARGSEPQRAVQPHEQRHVELRLERAHLVLTAACVTCSPPPLA
jgi:hypothetical protein